MVEGGGMPTLWKKFSAPVRTRARQLFPALRIIIFFYDERFQRRAAIPRHDRGDYPRQHPARPRTRCPGVLALEDVRGSDPEGDEGPDDQGVDRDEAGRVSDPTLLPVGLKYRSPSGRLRPRGRGPRCPGGGTPGSALPPGDPGVRSPVETPVALHLPGQRSPSDEEVPAR